MIKQKYIIDKKCSLCDRKVKVSVKDKNNKNFVCDTCLTHDPRAKLYCNKCGFRLMEGEAGTCRVCELKMSFEQTV